MIDAPKPVRIAVGLWLAVAVFDLFTAGGLWFSHDEIQRMTGKPSGDVTDFLLTLTVVSIVIAAIYGVLTWMFVKRRGWSRPALSIVAIVHLLWLLFLGVSLANLITLLLICVAIVFTWNPRAAEWTAEVRER